MNLLHPWALGIGLAAATLPVLIHWLTRPRPQALPWPALRFLRQAIEQKRARWRLRDWLVLALRTAAILLLAGAIARPLGSSRRGETDIESGATLRVVVLDASQSMAAGEHGVRALERARVAAANWLKFEPGLRANLIVAAASPRAIFDQCSLNLAALNDELSRAGPRPEALHAQAAIARASEMLSRTDAAAATLTRELIVVSDFQRTNWSSVDFAVLPVDARIELESVAPRTPPPNLAILRAECVDRGAAEQESQLEVEVANYSPANQTVNVEVGLETATVRLSGVAPAGGRVTLSQPIEWRSAGWQSGRARLVDVRDGLEADNVRWLAAEARRPPRYALVTRQAAGHPVSSAYLELALAPAPLTRVDPLRLDREALLAADLIVVDHPGKLATDAATLIGSLVRRGRALLYVAGEPIDAANLKALAEQEGSAWKLPVEFATPPAGRARQNLFIAHARDKQPPLSAFGAAASSLLAPLRFGGGLATHPAPDALADDVVAEFDDRSACLVTGVCGAGKVAVLNADLAASNLPSEPIFAPLVEELASYLLDRGAGDRGARSGEPLAIYLPYEAGGSAGLQKTTSNDFDGDLGELVDEGSQVAWMMRAAGPPGVYELRREGQIVFSVAVNAPAEESDLRPLESSVFEKRLAGGRQLRMRDALSDEEEEDSRDDAWIWLLTAGMAAILIELVVLERFRS